MTLVTLKRRTTVSLASNDGTHAFRAHATVFVGLFGNIMIIKNGLFTYLTFIK
jgi:hypothetical protein